MFPDVFAGVTSTTPLHIQARLAGWTRHGLLDREYPGALPDQDVGQSIDGVLWLNVCKPALDALDRFEGDEYERVGVTALGADGMHYQALIYQWLLPGAICGSWCRHTFEQVHRRHFLNRHWRGN
jgi:gamma-glutamylcyclotransferase (GGCT)/AIG2-like uncharacterized protein YtfP